MTQQELTPFQKGKIQLQEIELKWQKEWETSHLFEANPPKDYKKGDDKKKFFTTFPYPYMNGRLHLGHLFTVSKTEFAAGYHRMNGYNTLFPFAFHVTGQPICGAAKKLEMELKQYGCPPVAPKEDLEKPKEQKPVQEKEIVVGQFKARHTKAVAKTSQGKFQYDILKEMSVPENEIPEFVDPYKWVKFFPQLCKQDMMRFGARVDWRRSFVTTDANPIYDAFVRWQFNTLKRGGYISFGKRNTIWSPLDDQPCMDHDRLSGEGVQVQEYVVVLTELIRDHVNNKQMYGMVGDETIYLGCATLRPETMCGQTNVWVLPEGEYVVFRIDKKRVLIAGEHAAYNMSFQTFNNGLANGEIDEIGRITGQQLINCVVSAPLTPYKQIPVYPLTTINMEKGTGIVTSVPSDAPDDYIALKDVQMNYNGIIETYKIDISLLKDIKPIEIIEIPEFGRCSAVKLCEDKGVQNQNDRALLKEIKDMCYQKGFYEGVMISGPFTGKKVSECKGMVKQHLIQLQQAIPYAEPESEIIARSGCACVVCLTDQWFVDYGEEKWKQVALEALKNIDCYNDEVKHQFERVLDWLKQWALSRTFGLGTRIPWDKQFLIESLSDSTIYNSFYTLAHELQNGDLFGGKCQVPTELLDDAFFDYVYDISDKLEEKHTPYTELMTRLKQSFQYFYPVDLRCSGKDLVPNHLTFFIYNHCAIWSKNPEYWPRGIRANGHLMLNDKKMSKGSGNFLTAFEAIDKFTADGVRFALADAGDGNDDANFKTETAEAGVAKIMQFYNNAVDMLQKAKEYDASKSTKDLIFQAQFYDCAVRINKSFERCLFREGMITLMNEMQKAKDLYVKTCDSEKVPPNLGLVKEYIFVATQLLAIICPHISEEINAVILGNTKSIFLTPINQEYLEQQSVKYARYINTYDQIVAMIQRLRMRWNDVTKPKKDGSLPPKPKSGVVYVATEFSEWQEKAIEYLGQKFKECGGNFDKSIVGDARNYVMNELKVDPKEGKKVIKFITDVIALSKTDGEEAFIVRMPFDEKEVYSEYAFLICSNLYLENVQVFSMGEGPITADKCAAAQPGRPIIFFDVKNEK